MIGTKCFSTLLYYDKDLNEFRYQFVAKWLDVIVRNDHCFSTLNRFEISSTFITHKIFVFALTFKYQEALINLR